VVRVWVRSVVALVLVVAAAVIGWRVLAPAEVLSPATSSVLTVSRSLPGATGRTNVAPLIVDGRVRVYGTKRQVRADGRDVNAKFVYTARWSFRRWPQQLSGLVAIGTTVISRWSDGQLIALDAVTGRIVWRADGPPAPKYAGHRTGASTVWAPPGLHVADTSFLVSAGRTLTSYDGPSGTRRWQIGLPSGCTDGFTTAGGQFVCATGVFDTNTGLAVGSWPGGPYAAIGCEVAAAECAGVRDGSGKGWLTGGDKPHRSVALDRPDSTVAAGLVLYPGGDALRSADANGKPGPTFPTGQVLGASNGKLVLLTPKRAVLEMDPKTGSRTAGFALRLNTENLKWSPGRWQLVDGHVAVERLAQNGPSNPETNGYYFSVDPVIIAAL
jgi:hypothetical protein